jgi:hypothetical protein
VDNIVDLLPYTQAELDARLAAGDPFIKGVLADAIERCAIGFQAGGALLPSAQRQFPGSNRFSSSNQRSATMMLFGTNSP